MGRQCRYVHAVVWLAWSFAASQTPCAWTQETISGTVMFSDSWPVEGARVRVRATDNVAYTDANGRFDLERGDDPDAVTITAWKQDYYSVGTQATWGDQDLSLVLVKSPTTDNPNYEWVPPRGETSCSNCHSGTIVPQWEANLHSQSVMSPLVQTMYSGTDIDGNLEETLGGYCIDWPGGPGNCASCHAPGAAANNPYGVFLDQVTGVNANGVHCDFCHKIYDTVIPRSGMPGVLSIELRRPSAEGRSIFFGPFDDIASGDDSLLPAQSKSRFCAPCHTHESHGVPIYQSFPEWFDSAYRTAGVECQDCHNTPNGTMTNIAPDNEASVERDPNTIPSHNMMGEDRAAFIASAVELDVVGEILSDRFRVSVTVTNSGAGHHFPTGQPMRNAILVVSATTSDGQALVLLDGEVVSEHGGDLAGRPGRLYAKILREIHGGYPGIQTRPMRIPAPQWALTRIISDTRIPAMETDESQFDFAKPSMGLIELKVDLVYRRAFYSFAEIKGWTLPDMPVAYYEGQFDPYSPGNGDEPFPPFGCAAGSSTNGHAQSPSSESSSDALMLAVAGLGLLIMGKGSNIKWAGRLRRGVVPRHLPFHIRRRRSMSNPTIE
jgi:hypothetical protein